MGITKGERPIDGCIVEGSTEGAGMSRWGLDPEGVIGVPSWPPAEAKQPFDPKGGIRASLQWGEADGVDACMAVGGYLSLCPTFVGWELMQTVDDDVPHGLGLRRWLGG